MHQANSQLEQSLLPAAGLEVRDDKEGPVGITEGSAPSITHQHSEKGSANPEMFVSKGNTHTL